MLRCHPRDPAMIARTRAGSAVIAGELLGITDIIECADGNKAGCLWLVAMIPIAKPLKVLKAGKIAEATATAAKTAEAAADIAKGVPPRFVSTGAGVTVDRLAVNNSISVQRQGRHVLGARQYGGGSYFGSADDAQRVLDDFHSGAAEVLGVKGSDIVVRAPGVTGFNHNPGAGFPNQPTNVFFIKGTTSPSVVPYNPGWRP